MNEFVDLHIHSCASDGTCTSEQIIEKALENNVSIIALTDHNTLENSKEVSQLAKQRGITAINGVEIDADLNEKSYHILALGIDYGNPDLQNLIKNNRTKLRSINRRLIECMLSDYSQLDLAEYDEYTYDRTRGGWESLNYLYDKGITESLYGGFPYAEKYNCTTRQIEFPSVKETVNIIHRAGGYAILAHPVCYFEKGKEITEHELRTALNTMKNQAIDGVECYYPKNSGSITQICTDWCKENNMIITGGCDFHGDFLPHTKIGKIKIKKKMLNINKLLK